MNQAVSGFSKLSKDEKINWIAQTYFSNPEQAIHTLKQYWNNDQKLQQLHDEFIENTVSKKLLKFEKKNVIRRRVNNSYSPLFLMTHRDLK